MSSGIFISILGHERHGSISISDRSYHVREIARRVPLTRQRVLTIWYLLLVWIVGARNGVLALILAGKAAGAGLIINVY